MSKTPVGKSHALLEDLLNGDAITMDLARDRYKLYALSQAIGYLRRRYRLKIENIGEYYLDESGVARKCGKYRVPPPELQTQRTRFGRQ